MSVLLNYFDEITEYAQAIAEVKKPAEFSFKLDNLVSNFKYMYDRFCPYKEDDKVMLASTLLIEKDSGWYGSRHFLVEGAIATVTSTNFNKGLFWFGLEFDNESYIDSKGNTIPTIRKCVYTISELYLTRPNLD